jgi:hypothetical protein
MRFNRLLKQKAVYWALLSSDGYGEKYFSDAVEISCRWLGKAEKYTNPEGEEKTSKSNVISLTPMTVGGYLKLCGLVDLDSDMVDNPTEDDGAFEIKQISVVPNLKATVFLNRAIL